MNFNLLIKILKILLCIAICVGFGFVSGFYGGSPTSDWYLNLNKPFFQPPPSIFGPAWTLLYTLMGIAVGLIWIGPSQGGLKGKAIALFVMQFILNLIWSPVFFRFQNPILALGIIVVMLMMILVTIITFNKVNRRASLLMLPYLCWVCFATLLNASIIYLN